MKFRKDRPNNKICLPKMKRSPLTYSQNTEAYSQNTEAYSENTEEYSQNTEAYSQSYICFYNNEGTFKMNFIFLLYFMLPLHSC